MTYEAWRRWLVAVGVAVAAFGLAMAALAGTPAFAPIAGIVDQAFWSPAGPDHAAASFQAWALGVWGATLAGWGVTVAWLAFEALRRHERWAWRAMALGAATWFILDTGRSAVHGVWANVAINVVLGAAIACPLVAMRRDVR